MKLSNAVTPENITESIKNVQWHVMPGTTLTICLVTLYNGYTVTGESACVNPDNFNRVLGEQYSYENAKEKIWPLLGFLLAHQNWEADQ